MPLYTESYLKNRARKQLLNENVRLFSSMQNRSTFDIFLSHSYLDKEVVEGMFIELTALGYSVYVDWIVDPEMDRSNVTRQSARIIQERLKSSKSLLLAISPNAAISKWIPWELGYVDGNTQLCAIVPVVKENQSAYTFERKEYLLLYPFIKKIPNQNNVNKLWVAEADDEYIVFDQWLKKVRPSKRNVNIAKL